MAVFCLMFKWGFYSLQKRWHSNNNNRHCCEWCSAGGTHETPMFPPTEKLGSERLGGCPRPPSPGQGTADHRSTWLLALW